MMAPEASTRIEVLKRWEAANGRGSLSLSSGAVPAAATGSGARSGTETGSSHQKSVPTASAAIRGDNPETDDEAYGVVGSSASVWGAGVAAVNTEGGADLVLDGSIDGMPDTRLSEWGIDRSDPGDQVFAVTNSGGGAITFDVFGTLRGTDLQCPSCVSSSDLAEESVSSIAIEDDGVTEVDIAPGAVNSVHIFDGSVRSADLAANAVAGGTIADGSITAADLADGAVTSLKLGTSAVVTTKIGDEAVTSRKIAAGAVDSDSIRNNAVTSDKIAADAVTGAKILNSSVTMDDLAAESVGADQIEFGGVQAHHVDSGAIGTGQLADGAVTAEKLAVGVISGATIEDGTITDEDLAIAAVTLTKIQDHAVGGSKIAPEAVTNSKIFSGAVTGDKLADGAVTAQKVASSEIQLRVATQCPVGSSIRYIDAMGGVSCETDDGADLTPPVEIIGPSNPVPVLLVSNTGANGAIYGVNDAPSPTIHGVANGDDGTGLSGEAYGSAGVGLHGYSLEGIGVQGDGDTVGGYFEARHTQGVGIHSVGGISGVAARFDGNVLIRDRDTHADIIELGKGLDYAEGFDVSDDEILEPGTVLIIDPETPGELRQSSRAYDTRVAGIIAGANGLGSGVRLGADGFDHDVALAGRVYCKVDSTKAGIRPGDLLTTSSIPGHAMKATDADRARGAILGKAMEPLEAGTTGQVLVLVGLQ